MIALSRKAIVVPKPFPKRITAMSDIFHSITKDFWLKKPRFWPMWIYFEGDAVREQVGRVGKSAFFDVRRFNAISDLSLKTISTD